MHSDLHFIRATAVRPHFDLTAPADNTFDIERHRVELGELAVESDPATSLAERGFAAVPFAAASEVRQGKAIHRGRFAEAASRAARELVGARGVMLLPESLMMRRGNSHGADTAIPLCHSDFTAVSAASKFARLQQAHPQLRAARRFAIYNLWWLASSPPLDRPLALCDATTVAPADLMAGTALVGDGEGRAHDFEQVAFYRYNQRQRWSWYPELTPDSLLVFAAHDSDPGFASQVPHCAFVNRQFPAGNPTRISIECRCFAYW